MPKGGFQNVRPPTREMQSNQGDRDASMAAAQGTIVGQPQVGDTSPNYYDDPTVNALVEKPNLAAAQQYMGSKPSFYGIQRSGDYERSVQMQMAADKLGSREALGRLIEARTDAARAAAGDNSASSFATARAMGGGYSAIEEGRDKIEGALRRTLGDKGYR